MSALLFPALQAFIFAGAAVALGFTLSELRSQSDRIKRALKGRGGWEL